MSGLPPSPPSSGPTGGGTGSKARWATTAAGTTVELAGIGARFGARFLDMVLIRIVTGVAIFFAVDLDDAWGPATSRASIALITVAVGVLYEVWMIAVKGQTVGKMAVGIEVRRADAGELPGWDSSLRRWLLPGLAGAASASVSIFWLSNLLGVAGFVVYASLLWGRNRQGWHDRVANTLVVRKGRPIVWLIVVISVGGVALLAAAVFLLFVVLLWSSGI